MTTINPEPADTQGRKQAGLEPKSFAAAAREGAEAASPDLSTEAISDGPNGAKDTTNGSVPRYVPDQSPPTLNGGGSYAGVAKNGVPRGDVASTTAASNGSDGPTFADAAKGNIKHEEAKDTPASGDNDIGYKVLSIVDTHGEKAAKEQKEKAENEAKLKEESDKKEQEEEDLRQKVLEQQDAMTAKEEAKNKTATKKSSKKDNVSEVEKEELEAVGLDEAPRTPTRSRHRKMPSTSKSGSRPPSGSREADNKNTVVFEKFEDQQRKEKLTSVQSTEDYEKQLLLDRKEAPEEKKDRDEGLVSGREALKSWDRSGIRFAPWNIPLQRRLQTSVVLFHTLCIALSVSLFFFICAIPIFWPLMIPYLIYCLTNNSSTSGTLRLRSERLRSSPVWSLFASYFPARLHRTVELVPTRKYIFGYHPHGIISHGAFAAFGTEALGFKQLFPGITNTLLTLDSNFRIPIYRDYALAMGLASVSKESCENLLTKGGPNKEGMGRAITIVVGGARESLDAKPNTLRLVLKRRFGFIKIALRTGADLVPVIAFGENDLYDQFLPDEHPRIHKMQLVVKKFLGFTIPLFHARGVFNYDVGLMPYRRPLNIVVGRPIRVEKEEKPSQETLERLHDEYTKEVQRLWDTWKDDFATERKEDLSIVE